MMGKRGERGGKMESCFGRKERKKASSLGKIREEISKYRNQKTNSPKLKKRNHLSILFFCFGKALPCAIVLFPAAAAAKIVPFPSPIPIAKTQERRRRRRRSPRREEKRRDKKRPLTFLARS
jgi:hypothetical protein